MTATLTPDLFTREYVNRFTEAPPTVTREFLMNSARTLHQCGLPVFRIAEAVELDRADVLDAIGLDYVCQDCDRALDLNSDKHGTYAEVLIEGDRSEDKWVTECCEAFFVNRNGVEYIGPGPWGGGE